MIKIFCKKKLLSSSWLKSIVFQKRYVGYEMTRIDEVGNA